MGGHGEEDERGIEDTIHEKASSVVRARKRTKETARELDEAERILERLRDLDEEVRQIEAAQADLHATRQPLIEELCVLEDAVLKNPIPGSPVRLWRKIPICSTTCFCSARSGGSPTRGSHPC